MNRDTILVSSFVNLSFAESEYLVYCSKNQFEISGKTYYKGNDITNTTSPVKITFFYTFIRIVNIWCKDVLKVLFSETSKPWDHLNQKMAQRIITSW